MRAHYTYRKQNLVYKKDYIMIVGDLSLQFSTESNLHLSRLIHQETESMFMSKERYDLDFPDHAKDISMTAMWQMARRKVLADLSEPPDAKADRIPRQGNVRMCVSFDF
jgi:hypothetical protein